MSEPSRWARTVVWDMFEKLELPKDTLLISAWAKEIDEAARKHGMVYAPNCPSCAEKDAEIERLRSEAKAWIEAMHKRLPRLDLDYDRAVAIAGWLVDLNAILRGEG